jgi:poly(A) polymerase
MAAACSKLRFAGFGIRSPAAAIASSGEIDAEIGEWWTAFYEGDETEREQLLQGAKASGASAGGGARRKRSPRRGPRNRNRGEGGGDSGGSGE